MNRESGSVITAVSGDRVEIDQSAVRSVDAERVELRQAAAQHVRGESLEMSDSAMLSVRGADIRMDDCAAGVVLGERVTMRGGNAILVFARHVDGDVKTVVTPVAAFAFGLGAMAGLAIWRRLRRR